MFVTLLTSIGFAMTMPLPQDDSTEQGEGTGTESTESKEAEKSETPEKSAKEKAKEKPEKEVPEKEVKAKTPKMPKEPKSQSSSDMPHVIVGLETGAALNTTELKAAFLPVWQVGVQLPYWQERLGFLIHGSYRVANLEGTGSNPSLTNGNYNYDIRQQEGEFGFNLRVRIPEVPVVVPEIQIGPTVQLLGTEVSGKSGVAFPTSTETQTRLGVHGALLGEYPLPVGSVIGGVHYTSYAFKTDIQGDVWSHAISPTIGYRYRFF